VRSGLASGISFIGRHSTSIAPQRVTNLSEYERGGRQGAASLLGDGMFVRSLKPRCTTGSERQITR